MEDIRKQAIEAAREHAHSVDDLITQAQKIEAYLTGRAYRADKVFTPDDTKETFDVKAMLGPITDIVEAEPEPALTPQQIKEAEVLAQLPKLVEHSATHLGVNPDKLVKALSTDEPEAIADLAKEIADLAGVHARPKSAELLAAERKVETIKEQKARDRAVLDVCEKVDLFSEPLPKRSDPTRHVHDYRYTDGTTERSLSPFFEFLAKDEASYVLNVSRSIGTTNFLAAMAREWRSKGRKVLVVVHNHTAARVMETLIDDASVTVVDFKHLEKWGVPVADDKGFLREPNTWDLVMIDNAAAIPYASEENIIRRLSVAKATRVIVASVPGQERGLFYDLWTGAIPLNDFMHELYNAAPTKKLALNWTFAHYGDLTRVRAQIGEEAWGNLYENKFRTSSLKPDADGATKLTD